MFAGRFELGERIGRGGFGSVFRARDRQTGRIVAVKILREVDAEGLERFARETELLSRLEHPGVVVYVSHGEVRSHPYLVTDWVDGITLSGLLRTAGVDAATGVDLVRRTAGALAALHDAGLVHRDVKPSNLIVRAGGEVTLIDLGMARSTIDEHRITSTGVSVGTPGFLAPEQARGLAVLTPAADVFALGCVLYTVLTGRQPFSGATPSVFYMKLLLEEPPPLSSACPESPIALRQLVADMLIKDPARRIADAHQVIARLDGLGPIPPGPRRVLQRGDVAATDPPSAMVPGGSDSQVTVATPGMMASHALDEPITSSSALTVVDASSDGVLVVGVADEPLDEGTRTAIEAMIQMFDSRAEVVCLPDGLTFVRASGAAPALFGRLVDAAMMTRTRCPERAVVVAPAGLLEWAGQVALEETFALMGETASERVILHPLLRECLEPRDRDRATEVRGRLYLLLESESEPGEDPVAEGTTGS